MTAPRLILASASPRRRELLALAGWSFELRPAGVAEVPHPGEAAPDYVLRISQAKARQATLGLGPGALVVGADTEVSLDGQILGKPADRAEARHMLTALRGRAHEVLTGLAVMMTDTGQVHTDLARSRVVMRAYADGEVADYVSSGNPLDKAGGYAIQHRGFQPVDTAQFVDCFANVMGLPLCHLLRMLRRLGLDAPGDVPGACQRFLLYQCPVFAAILQGSPA